MPKDSTKRYWLISGLYAFMERGASFVFGFGSFFILFRALEKEQVGLWVLFLTLCSFLEVSRMGLIQNALVKYLSSEDKKEHGKINTASLFLNIIISLIFVVLLLLLAPFCGHLWGEAIIPILYIYVLTTLVLTPMFHSNFILQANLSFRGIFLSNTLRQGLFFFFILALWLLNKPIELTHMAGFQAFTGILGSGVAIYYAKEFFVFTKKIDWAWVRKLVDFGRFAVATNLSIMLYKTADKLMLGGMISAISVALYEIAIKITNLMDIPTNSAAAVVFPQSAREMVKNGKEGIKVMYEQAVGAILALLIPAIIVVELFPEFIILIIAGEEYLDAVPLVRLTMLFGLFLPFGSQMGTVMESIGKPQINFYCTGIGLMTNVVLNYFFISKFGVIGAAYGSLLTYVIFFVVIQLILYKVIKVNTLNVFRYMFGFYKKGYSMMVDKFRTYFLKPTIAASNSITKDGQ